ncbi:MAG: hypothetical protein K0R12_893 [Gammaproteobacteria bacterium]|jgi:hypothetical protein|nr:hypothetical protein [Gammaproteobacteria bacterium]
MQTHHQLEVKPAYLINTILCFNILFAALWVWILPFSVWLQSMLTAIIIIACYRYYIRQYGQRIIALTLPRLFDSENTLWRVMTADRNHWQAIPIGQRYVSSHWVLIKLRLSSLEPAVFGEEKEKTPLQHTYLVCHSSQMSKRDWHHLVVICRS